MSNSTCCHVGTPQHGKAAFSLWHWSQRCHFMKWRWNFLCSSHPLWSLPVYSIHKPKIETKKPVLPKQQKVKEERIGSKINHFRIRKEINPWGNAVFVVELFHEITDGESTGLSCKPPTLTTASASQQSLWEHWIQHLGEGGSLGQAGWPMAGSFCTERGEDAAGHGASWTEASSVIPSYWINIILLMSFISPEPHWSSQPATKPSLVKKPQMLLHVWLQVIMVLQQH